MSINARKILSLIIALIIIGLPATEIPVMADSTNPAVISISEADAVNLEITKHYSVGADGSSKLHLYIKRRILTYKGKKDYADFKYTYNMSRQQVKLIRAVTTTAQGKILKVNAEEVHDIPAAWNSEVSLYSKARQMVVSLPAVEPGCQIEIELEVESRNGFWCQEYFRLEEPIVSKKVIIETPDSMSLNYLKPHHLKLKFTRQNSNNHTIYTWLGENIPALVPERGAASPLEQGFTLLVTNFSSWQQVAGFFAKSFSTALKTKTSPAIRPRTKDHTTVTTADNSPLSHRIYRKLRSLTVYGIDFQETDFKVQTPTETERLGYGTDCDLALCFTDRLRRHQQPARIIMADSQNRILKDFTGFPFPGWWDTALVQSGDDFFLFSDDKPAPGITGFDGKIGLDLEIGKLTAIKDRRKSSTETNLKLDLQDFPGCRGELTLKLKGAAATAWRSDWRDLSTPEREIAGLQFLHQINPTAKFTEKLSISGLKDDRKEFIFRCRFKLKNAYADFTGKDGKILYLLPLKAPDLPYSLSSLLKNRKQPLIVSQNRSIVDQITLQLPDNFRMIAMPPKTSGNLPQFSRQIECRYDKEHHILTYSREIDFSRGIIHSRTPEYETFINALRSLYQPPARRVILSKK